MTYSCGLFLTPDDTLAQAQKNKIDAIIQKAEIGPDAHVLEVGCGWGSFAIEAARQTGCRVTGITVSDAQLELASARVRDAGRSERVEIPLCDYRNIEGTFDRIVSIEMLEAVGHRNFGTYFAALSRVLKAEGRVVIQVITIPDQRYRQYRGGADFINKHIFPGGHLPSLGAITESASRHSSLNIEHVENIGAHYAPTLSAWCERLRAAGDDADRLGFDDAFIRKWEYYFCYCEAGFAARVLNNLQLVLRPTGR